MATVAHTFSPKEWKAAVVSDATNAGATGIGTTMNQLDVDSISFYYVNVSNIIPPGEKNKSRETKKIINMFKENLNIRFPILLDKYALIY